MKHKKKVKHKKLKIKVSTVYKLVDQNKMKKNKRAKVKMKNNLNDKR